MRTIELITLLLVHVHGVNLKHTCMLVHTHIIHMHTHSRTHTARYHAYTCTSTHAIDRACILPCERKNRRTFALLCIHSTLLTYIHTCTCITCVLIVLSI